MAIITGKTPQGNCGSVRCLRPGVYRVSPLPDRPEQHPNGVEYLNFYACITGTPGEQLQLQLVIPAFDEALCPFRKYKQSPFYLLAEKCIYLSTDRLHWQRLQEVRVAGDTVYISLTLPARRCYLSMNHYYTLPMHRALQEHMAGAPGAQAITIGHSRDGQPLTLYRVTDPSVGDGQKGHIYLQAGQHCCEFGGMHLLDALLRHLADDAPDFLGQWVFHILPVFSLADWTEGLVDELDGDPNISWDTLPYPEQRAVDAYLRSLPQKPCVLLDIHNARSTSFLILSSYVSPALVAAQTRLEKAVEAHCDLMAPGASKWTATEKWANFKQYALQNFGCAATVELSRFAFYHRQSQSPVAITDQSYQSLAAQLAQTLTRL